MTAQILRAILVALGCTGAFCEYGEWPVDGAMLSDYDIHLQQHINDKIVENEHDRQ